MLHTWEYTSRCRFFANLVYCLNFNGEKMYIDTLWVTNVTSYCCHVFIKFFSTSYSAVNLGTNTFSSVWPLEWAVFHFLIFMFSIDRINFFMEWISAFFEVLTCYMKFVRNVNNLPSATALLYNSKRASFSMGGAGSPHIL